MHTTITPSTDSYLFSEGLPTTSSSNLTTQHTPRLHCVQLRLADELCLSYKEVRQMFMVPAYKASPMFAWMDEFS